MYRTSLETSDQVDPLLNDEMVARYLTRKPNFVKRWFKDNASSDLLLDCIRLKEQNEYLTKPRASVTHEMFNSIVQGQRPPNRHGKSPLMDYMHLNENELFFELIRDIANELNVDVVCHKILTNVSILTNSDRGSLFLARGPQDARFLVSKLFDVTAGSTLEQSLHREDQQIIIPFGKGVAGHVALTKEYINIPDAYEVRKKHERKKISSSKEHESVCLLENRTTGAFRVRLRCHRWTTIELMVLFGRSSLYPCTFHNSSFGMIEWFSWIQSCMTSVMRIVFMRGTCTRMSGIISRNGRWCSIGCTHTIFRQISIDILRKTSTFNHVGDEEKFACAVKNEIERF